MASEESTVPPIANELVPVQEPAPEPAPAAQPAQPAPPTIVGVRTFEVPTAPPIEPTVPTMLGEILEQNVTFCVDTSGSMYNCLHVVKEQLIEALFKHARRDRDTLFNIIEFNTEVTQWADKMVKCTPETVAVAAEWINKLSATTGTNTQDALLTAFSDSQCRAVYLLTDGQPDHNVEDILDSVAYVCDKRPVHCIYISENRVDEAATEFLEDLATETYGSFHIVTLTTHGCVECITPVYRADHGSDRIIRTVEDHIRPNVKTCTISTTLAADPEYAMNMPRVSALYGGYPCFPGGWGPFLGALPQRYYWPHSWSRYRPAKAWLKMQDSMAAPIELSPSAGALLIGKRVMARRIDDGYFYMGTVQSQILHDKFLIAFGPCKHGKYKDTSYQDTYIYDIVDLVDAKRHTILTGDRVLAPWEPEGERYGPGIVIDGHERRCAEGSSDRELTVTFSNGKTETVIGDLAMWIPAPVYERLALELKMPRDARETLQTQDNYPADTLPGYPVSGPVARPGEYPQVSPVVMDSDTVFLDSALHRFPSHSALYPQALHTRRVKANVAVKSEDVNAVIPGTNMTQQELHDKVTSLLLSEDAMEKSDSEEREAERTIERKRLLKRRNKQKENSLKKSVWFNDANLVREAYINSNDVRLEEFDLGENDSGYATSPDLTEEREMIEMEKRDLERAKRLLELEVLDYERWRNQSSGARMDPRLFYRKARPIGRRPPWKYWKKEDSPGVLKVGAAHGPFRETALQAPLEARDQRNAAINSVEWKSPMFKYVDPQARGDYSNSVEILMKTPHPPSSKVDTCPREGAGVANSMGYKISTEMDKEAARREFKRQQIQKRDSAWQSQQAEENQMKLAMQDQHHQRVLEQLARDRDRQLQEQDLISQQREAKKKISVELRQRIEKNQEETRGRENQRIEALKRRRERREAIEVRRETEVENITVRRQQIKAQRCQARSDAYAAQLNEEDGKMAAVDVQRRCAKVDRAQHFRQLEDAAQKNKDLRVSVHHMQQAMLKSQIFP